MAQYDYGEFLIMNECIGKYEKLEELGRGIFGVVYKAREKVQNQLVAIKILHPYLISDPNFLVRFRKEAEIAANLDHPNLVPLYDFGESEGHFYIVMGYMPGGSLKGLIKQAGPISQKRTQEVLTQISDGLSYAHSHDVIHRDLKPSNILFDDEGKPRVSDIGFGELLHSESSASMSTSGGMIGMPAYMAPELWLDKKATKQTDQYSLACILVEMLTGKPLFDGESTPGIMTRHFRPLELPEALPGEWKPVIAQALKKKPEERFGSVTEFVSRLQLTEKKPVRVSLASWIKKDPADKKQSLPIRETERKTDPEEAAEIDSFPEQQESDQKSDIESDRTGGETRKNNSDDPETPETRAGMQDPASRDWREKTGSLRNKTPVYIGLALLVGLAIFLTLRIPGLSAKPQPTGPTMIREQDGMAMVYVAEGEFEMGSTTGDDDEKPVRKVYLDAYWIDKYEVSNRQYALCVAAGACSRPRSKKSETRSSYYGNPKYNNYPVMYVSWYQAQDYCECARGELPTEAQWEKAARGIDGRTYPWGDRFPNRSLANYDMNKGDTTKVSNYSAGASPYGALNMAGNVCEWVRDNYGPYQADELENSRGPTKEGAKVIRGGSWGISFNSIRAAYRDFSDPTHTDDGVGFRCSSPP